MGRTACTEPQCLYKGDLYLLSSKQFEAIRHVSLLSIRYDVPPPSSRNLLVLVPSEYLLRCTKCEAPYECNFVNLEEWRYREVTSTYRTWNT